MVTFESDLPNGPFCSASKNFHLLRGDCYFARFFPSPDGLLVPHHSSTRIRKERKPVCYAAPLKRADVDEEGTLRLIWWGGNEALKGDPQNVRPLRRDENSAASPVFLDAAMDVRRGTILEGVVTFAKDSKAAGPGVLIACEEGRSGAIQFVSSSATVGGTMELDGVGFAPDPRQNIDRQLPPKSEVRFRLLVRHSLIELYLDDVLLNVYSLPEAANGRIGFLNSAIGISELKAWTMTLPDEAPPQAAH